MSAPIFHRLSLLTGTSALDALAQTKVIIFGLGGVGGWCAEALVRSGIHHLTIVDSDVVCVTNINRQIQATTKTVGLSKVAELERRLKEINPAATITALHKIYSRDTCESFALETYDYIIDAIDSLSNKVDLIIRAHASGAKVITALGASGRLDPSRIKVSSLWESQNCPLGKFVRKRLRRQGFGGEVTCVWSDEDCILHEGESICGTAACHCPKMARQTHENDDSHEAVEAHEWCSSKKQINGSVVYITGIFGFLMAGVVVQDVVKRCGS